MYNDGLRVTLLQVTYRVLEEDLSLSLAEITKIIKHNGNNPVIKRLLSKMKHRSIMTHRLNSF